MTKTWPCTNKVGMYGLTYSDCSDMYAAACWIAAVAGVGVAIIGSAIGIPMLKHFYKKNLQAG